MKRPFYNAIHSLLFDQKHFLDALLTRFGGWLSDETYIKWDYYLNHSRSLNLENPQRYTEKLQWLKLYYRDPLWTQMVDKYRVKKLVSESVGNEYIKGLAEKLEGKVSEVSGAAELEAAVKASWADFGFAYREGGKGKQKYVLLKTGIKELAVARLQPEIDAFIKNSAKANGVAPEIDYIHGSEEVLKLGERENAVGILLPPIAKDSFFETINGRGPLPRKSFSMGEADEKRFYLECRKLF